MRIIDADGHVVEGRAFAAQVLERFPDHVTVDAGPDGVPRGLLYEGRRYPEPEGPGAGCPAEHGLTTRGDPNPYSVEGVLADADRDHIDAMVLFPSMGLAAPTFRDPAFAAGFSRLYNAFITDTCAKGRGRLLAVGVVPIEDVGASIAILREARDKGCVAAMIPPALRERNLDHPDLDPFYSAAEELDMPLGVHGAPGIHLPKIGVDRFRNYVQVHCVSFPFDQMTAMTAMVSGGVLDRHPRLRVAFLEAGVTWVPYFLDRLHEHYEKRGAWIENGWRRDPREYVERGQVYVSCEPDETVLPAVVDALGADFILYASDYPHWDCEFPESTRPLRERRDIDDATRAKILGGNAERFFGL